MFSCTNWVINDSRIAMVASNSSIRFSALLRLLASILPLLPIVAGAFSNNCFFQT